MKRIIFALFALCSLTAQAKVQLPKFFADNMVLQQQTECRIWGWADAGKTVTVTTSWDGKAYKTKAQSDGRFEVAVQTPVAGGPYDITLAEQKSNTQHPSPITQHPSPNTHHPTPITQHPTPITQHPSPNTQHPSPNTHPDEGLQAATRRGNDGGVAALP